MRKYAFGDVSVPREETQYLKIKYPAGYPALPEVRLALPPPFISFTERL